MNTDTPTTNQQPTFPKGDPAPADYFTGNAWVHPLVPNDATFNVVVGNVVFERGARNNWHFHPGGQILIVTEGVGYYQERGKPIEIIKKGDVIRIPPNLEHWHGASAESGMTHIAMSTNTQLGVVTWLDRVTDKEYNSYTK
ncbi:cupin domain-containing protein [Chryseolinea sp. Jin1]|uniref:Cupin domain-containing protein n=2 Tax=Chryseolinea lacunae TaxID=2801331 RepID=A0ABS1KWF6_9BACT|nr:cupin domain-containing protein [Chryseolinea lacunae]